MIPNLVASAFPNWLVNCGSLSLMIFDGSLNHRTTLSKYSCVTPGPVIVVWQGRKMAALEHPWSTIVRMASCPLRSGSPVMRSMATDWKGSIPCLVGIR